MKKIIEKKNCYIYKMENLQFLKKLGLSFRNLLINKEIKF